MYYYFARKLWATQYKCGTNAFCLSSPLCRSQWPKNLQLIFLATLRNKHLTWIRLYERPTMMLYQNFWKNHPFLLYCNIHDYEDKWCLQQQKKFLWMGFLWVFERKVLDAVDCCLHMQKHIFFHCKQRTFSFIILTNGTYYFIEFNF